jgi:P27 family predicted phage terminase small subunit
MARGRKPKPTWLKVITGNPGRRPLNREEPQPDGNLREPPHWFSARQRILWDVCIAAAPAGLLKLLDSTVLETFIVAKSLHEEAALKIEQYGAVVKSADGGHARSPYVGILNQQSAVMLKCAAEMGFTPSSRSRVKVSGSNKTRNAFRDLREFDCE